MKRGIAFLLVCLMLGGCGEVEAAPTPTPTVAVTVVPEVTQSASALQVSDELGERSVVAELNAWGEWELFLFSDEPLSELLISILMRYETVDKEIVIEERAAQLYLPELAAGEAIRMADEMPEELPHFQISYLTAAGKYEVVHLGDNGRDGGGILIPAEPRLNGALYLGEGRDDVHARNVYSGNMEGVMPLLESGALADDVPMGLTVYGGAVADINCDGIEDVALSLVSDGAINAYYISFLSPVHLLLGKADGGYEVAQKFESDLFVPGRGSSHIEAGEGYIELHYELVGGAFSNHTMVLRFSYDAAAEDWILSEFGYCFTYRPNYMIQVPDMIAAPEHLRVPISTHNVREAVEEVRPELYDVTAEFGNRFFAVNRTETGYEGVIYYYWEYNGETHTGITCTIAGELPADMELAVRPTEWADRFYIGNDRWTWNPQPASFYKNLPW